MSARKHEEDVLNGHWEAGTREPGGGGSNGGNLPHNLEAVEAPPPNIE